MKLEYTIKKYNITTAAFSKSKYEFLKLSGFRQKVFSSSSPKVTEL